MTKALQAWGFSLFPPTPAKILALGATFKEGGYRSTPNFFTSYRTEAQRQGFEITGVLHRHFEDAKRSCNRGLGGPSEPGLFRSTVFTFSLLAPTLWYSAGRWVPEQPCRSVPGGSPARWNYLPPGQDWWSSS